MKIRFGFVSNSSTTSFCILGITFEKGDIKIALLDEFYGEEDWYQEKKKAYENGEISKEELCTYDIGYDIESKTELTTYSHPYGSEYIGLSIGSMKEDETLKEFKERAKKQLEKVIDKDIEADIIIQGWRDG